MSTSEGAVNVLEMPFNAAMTTDACKELREFLDLRTNPSMMAVYGFLVMDREEMVAMLQSVEKDNGEGETLNLLNSMRDMVEGIVRFAELAKMVEARALVAAHIAFDVAWEDPDPAAPADEVLA